MRESSEPNPLDPFLGNREANSDVSGHSMESGGHKRQGPFNLKEEFRKLYQINKALRADLSEITQENQSLVRENERLRQELEKKTAMGPEPHSGSFRELQYNSNSSQVVNVEKQNQMLRRQIYEMEEAMQGQLGRELARVEELTQEIKANRRTIAENQEVIGKLTKKLQKLDLENRELVFGQESDIFLVQTKSRMQQIEIENVNLTKRACQLSKDLMAREEQVFFLEGRLLEETGKVQLARKKEMELRQKLTFSQELTRGHPLNSIKVTNAIDFNNRHVMELEEEIMRLQIENREIREQMYDLFGRKDENGKKEEEKPL
jgi:chromosome segregation ATPase